MTLLDTPAWLWVFVSRGHHLIQSSQSFPHSALQEAQERCGSLCGSHTWRENTTQDSKTQMSSPFMSEVQVLITPLQTVWKQESKLNLFCQFICIIKPLLVGPELQK